MLYLFNMPQQFMILMKQKYPFGEIAKALTTDSVGIVRKILHYQSQEQFNMIKDMIHFLKAAKHQYLVNISRVLQDQGSIQLYYQYVPLRLEKWLIDVNQELVEQLEAQILELAEYLIRANIKFQFDSESIGLSEDMTIKYFLNEFSIDLENKDDNFAAIQKEIQQFFKKLKNNENVEIEKCYQKARFESVSTNGSISTYEQFQQITQSMNKIAQKQDAYEKSALNSCQLSAIVENSKRKSMEVLSRFKKIGPK